MSGQFLVLQGTLQTATSNKSEETNLANMGAHKAPYNTYGCIGLTQHIWEPTMLHAQLQLKEIAKNGSAHGSQGQKVEKTTSTTTSHIGGTCIRNMRW